MTVLAFASIALSGGAAFVAAYGAYRPVWNWLSLQASKDARKYGAWSDELVLSWTPTRIKRAALAARIAIVAIAILTVVVSGSMVLAAAAAYVTFWVPTLIHRLAKERRLNELNEQLPDAVSIMVSSVRAGSALSAAIEDVANKMPAPVADVFAIISREHQSGGVSVADALARARATVPVEAFTMVSSALIISSTQGGDLLSVLERMAESTRALSRLKKKIITETSEVRAQEKVILVMTPLFGSLVCLFDPAIPDVLFHSTLGNALIIVVVGVQILCVGWIRSIVKTTV